MIKIIQKNRKILQNIFLKISHNFEVFQKIGEIEKEESMEIVKIGQIKSCVDYLIKDVDSVFDCVRNFIKIILKRLN